MGPSRNVTFLTNYSVNLRSFYWWKERGQGEGWFPGRGHWPTSRRRFLPTTRSLRSPPICSTSESLFFFFFLFKFLIVLFVHSLVGRIPEIGNVKSEVRWPFGVSQRSPSLVLLDSLTEIRKVPSPFRQFHLSSVHLNRDPEGFFLLSYDRICSIRLPSLLFGVAKTPPPPRSLGCLPMVLYTGTVRGNLNHTEGCFVSAPYSVCMVIVMRCKTNIVSNLPQTWGRAVGSVV